MTRQVARLVGTFAAVAALTCSPLSAATITFYSGDGGDVVNGGAAVSILPHPAWGDVSTYAGLLPGVADWISYENTGYEDGASVAPNAPDRALGNQTAQFTRTFDILNGGSFSLWILADDTATVRLLGPGSFAQTLFTAFPLQIDPCAPGGLGGGLGCMQADMGSVTLSNLIGGLYTLEVNVFQTNGWVFGTQYAGKVDTVPEPASLLLVGTGLSFIAIRRRQQKNAETANRNKRQSQDRGARSSTAS